MHNAESYNICCQECSNERARGSASTARTGHVILENAPENAVCLPFAASAFTAAECSAECSCDYATLEGEVRLLNYNNAGRSQSLSAIPHCSDACLLRALPWPGLPHPTLPLRCPALPFPTLSCSALPLPYSRESHIGVLGFSSCMAWCLLPLFCNASCRGNLPSPGDTASCPLAACDATSPLFPQSGLQRLGPWLLSGARCPCRSCPWQSGR